MVDAVTTGNAAGRINSGSAMLVSNFETFLSLLTAQLKNQDPLSPMDSNEFTAQLTQMAGVEQQLLTNDLLTSLLAAQQAAGMSDAASYIGNDAIAVWSAVRFEDGQANWSYELANNASEVTLQVLDGSGAVVWTGDAPERGSGIHDFSWDGSTTAGGQATDGGVYTLRVVARNAVGAAIDSQVLIRGRVSGVELYNGEPYLSVGTSILPLSSLLALNAPASRTAEQANGATPSVPADDAEQAGLIASLLSSVNPLKLLS